MPAPADVVREAGRTDGVTLLPEPDLRSDTMWTKVAAVAETLADSLGEARALAAGTAYPLAAYDRFRRDIGIRPPPGAIPAGDDMTVIVDSSRAAPFLLRETLRSLQDQSVRGWRAIVLSPPDTAGHPVASFADVDARIRFVPVDHALPRDGRVLLVTAGTRLDPEALAWLLFAGDRTAASAVFADHDHGVIVPGRGPVRTEPWLYWARDRAALPHIPAPALVLADATLAAGVLPVIDGSDGWRRATLIAAAGAVPHVPRLLSTIVELPLIARGGRPVEADQIAGHLSQVRFIPPRRAAAPTADDRIAIVIPTRDGADMLARAIATMRATARKPDRLDIIIVDNRSSHPDTAALIARLTEAGEARRFAFDAPFNWALASNLGARDGDAPILVFANNDLEMTRKGWDDVLVEALADPAVGAVGARLLYPNRTLQHGGVVFGMGPGHPEHEGRGYVAADPGPARRLVIPRAAASVTGAFLACRRDLFEAVGGFDAATMFVGHSDVDFCLKVREAGKMVHYVPEIEAIHYESVTRGRNETKAQVAWDEGERVELIDRWGVSLVIDPGVNPYWAKGGTPFDALRDPAMTEIVRHIDLTGRIDPWRPSRRIAQEEAAWAPGAIGWG